MQKRFKICNEGRLYRHIIYTCHYTSLRWLFHHGVRNKKKQPLRTSSLPLRTGEWLHHPCYYTCKLMYHISENLNLEVFYKLIWVLDLQDWRFWWRKVTVLCLDWMLSFQNTSLSKMKSFGWLNKFNHVLKIKPLIMNVFVSNAFMFRMKTIVSIFFSDLVMRQRSSISFSSSQRHTTSFKVAFCRKEYSTGKLIDELRTHLKK